MKAHTRKFIYACLGILISCNSTWYKIEIKHLHHVQLDDFRLTQKDILAQCREEHHTLETITACVIAKEADIDTYKGVKIPYYTALHNNNNLYWLISPTTNHFFLLEKDNKTDVEELYFDSDNILNNGKFRILDRDKFSIKPNENDETILTFATPLWTSQSAKSDEKEYKKLVKTLIAASTEIIGKPSISTPGTHMRIKDASLSHVSTNDFRSKSIMLNPEN